MIDFTRLSSFITILFIISSWSCSMDDQSGHRLAGANGVSANEATDASEGDEEEEITAVPPAVISGSFLTCEPVSKDTERQTASISCHLEKDGSVLTEPHLAKENFSSKDNEGKDTLIDFHTQGDGFYFLLVLTDHSDVNISLQNVDSEDEASITFVISINEIEDIENNRANDYEGEVFEDGTTMEFERRDRDRERDDRDNWWWWGRRDRR